LTGEATDIGVFLGVDKQPTTQSDPTLPIVDERAENPDGARWSELEGPPERAPQ